MPLRFLASELVALIDCSRALVLIFWGPTTKMNNRSIENVTSETDVTFSFFEQIFHHPHQFIISGIESTNSGPVYKFVFQFACQNVMYRN